MRLQTGLILCAALLLAACGTPPQRGGAGSGSGSSAGSGGYLPGDGPGDADASRVAAVPDAVPRNEPLHRYANRPYEALGVRYVPLTEAGHYRARGTASWYGKKFHGQRTSSGEVYDMYAMTAAHKTLPIPSYARVTNLANGRSVIVRVNDRGPFVANRIIDLSYAAAYKLGMIQAGHAEVEVQSLVPGRDVPAVEPMPRAPVEVQTLPPAALPPPAPPAPPAPPVVSVATPAGHAGRGNIFLQLGSFRSAAGAREYLERMRARLGNVDQQLSLFRRGGLTRVHLGPYRTADEARAAASALASQLGFKPFVSVH